MINNANENRSASQYKTHFEDLGSLFFFSFFTQNIGKVFYITRALSSEVQLQTLFHELLINYNLQFQSQCFYSNIHYCATSTFDRPTINIAQL